MSEGFERWVGHRYAEASFAYISLRLNGVHYPDSPEGRSARMTDARDRAVMARDAYDAMTREDG